MQSSDSRFNPSNGNTADISTSSALQPTQENDNEDPTAKVIIGAASTSADGILVLESDTRAMVLSMVNSTDDLTDYSPGMMVYIKNKTLKDWRS